LGIVRRYPVGRVVFAAFVFSTPAYVLGVYPDVNGFGPILEWLASWGLVLVLAVVAQRPLDAAWARLVPVPGSPSSAGRFPRLRRAARVVPVLVGLAVLAPGAIYAGLVYLLSPWALPVIGAIAVLLSLRARPRIAIPVRAACAFVWLCLAFACLWVRIPSSRATCESLDLPDGVRPLLTRMEIDSHPELEGAFPYEARLADGSLLVTFKNLWGPGAVARFYFDGRAPLILKTFNPGSPGETCYPERFCLDEDRKVLFATLKTRGHEGIVVADYSNGGLVALPTIETPGIEPTNCLWERDTATLFVLSMTPQIGVRAYRFPRGPGGGAEARPLGLDAIGGFFGDYLFREPGSSRVLFASWVAPRAHLIGIDPKSLAVEDRPVCTGWTGCPHPLGIGGDAASTHVYLSDLITSEIVELDASTLEVTAVSPVSRFPRKIAIDDDRHRLFVNCYGAGTVDELAIPGLALLRSVPLGRLVRSVAFDRASGNVVATSSCGVFALE